MGENGRRKWKSGRDVERSWSLGPEQDLVEMLVEASEGVKEVIEV
jgi:hypothetical protein